MDKGTEPPKPTPKEKRRFRGKVTPRVTVEDRVVKAVVPDGSRFRGHEPFLVQDLVISASATCYSASAGSPRMAARSWRHYQTGSMVISAPNSAVSC
jgi:hypothetical protein